MQYAIKIPEFLLEKLKRSTYNKLVEDILSNYSEWIARNETIFFREYTDHGIDHLESVLETSVLLLSDKSKDIFSDSDACLLVISTILHDIALHIQEDQFIKLVEKDGYCHLIKDLDSETWHSLWIKYSAEASRFSQSQLQLYFGVNEIMPVPDIKSPLTWTPLQYQLIGEFLRRHHPRLAHDFAVFGFPAVENGKSVFIKTESGHHKKFIDLAGLVARSHGTSLRSLFDYLKNNFGHLRDQEGSHAIFIMAVLRIADYLQIQSSRAPKSQMIIKNLKSPLSRREWNIHAAIQNIIYNKHEDPESVEIIIDPSTINIELYLRIQSLLTSIQKELDHSWAVLGEVFGRYDENALGLTIRRIRSNIDDKNKFSKQAGFVTEKATFSAADAELLKLFIKPLYGDKPEIAVRELVQNSVDAVRERLIFEPELAELDNSPSVSVSIHKVEESKWMLRIEDKGIGMSLNTIMNYFLNAGASYRLSTVWKEKFTDEKGKAKVLRSGRFGVGALAAFMLAEDPTKIEMKVTTRHIASAIDGAFEFTTKLSDTPIQIKYIEKKEPGTIIEIITLSPPAFMQESTKENSSNSWDWYCLDKPIVERFSLTGKRLQQNVLLPSSIETSKLDYHWITPKEYDSIGWSYSDFPPVVCNGIIVVGQKNNSRYTLEDGIFINKEVKISMPSISIFDKDGKLPITLDRLRIEFEQLQFLGEIREDIEKNILAFLLVTAPNKGIINNKTYNPPLLRTHPAIKDTLNSIPWLITESGSCIYCPELLSISRARSIIEIEDPSIIPFLLSNISDESKNVGFAVEIISIWEEIQKSNLKVLGGTRLKVERQRITERKLYSILDLLDKKNTKEKYSRVPDRVVTKYLEKRYNSVFSSPFQIIGLMREELYHFSHYNTNNDSLQSIYRFIYDIEEKFHKGELSISNLKQMLYWLGNMDGDFSINKVFALFDRIDGNLKIEMNLAEKEEMVYRIEREIEHLFERNYYRENEEYFRLREEFRYKFQRTRLQDLNYNNLELILHEIRDMSEVPPIIKVETFGNYNSVLNWDKLKSLNFNSRTINFPITEISIDDSFKYTSSNNFISKIWMEYIGKTEIPLDEIQRSELILSIQSKFGMERHIEHWKSALTEQISNKNKI